MNSLSLYSGCDFPRDAHPLHYSRTETTMKIRWIRHRIVITFTDLTAPARAIRRPTALDPSHRLRCRHFRRQALEIPPTIPHSF